MRKEINYKYKHNKLNRKAKSCIKLKEKVALKT